MGGGQTCPFGAGQRVSANCAKNSKVWAYRFLRHLLWSLRARAKAPALNSASVTSLRSSKNILSEVAVMCLGASANAIVSSSCLVSQRRSNSKFTFLRLTLDLGLRFFICSSFGVGGRLRKFFRQFQLCFAAKPLSHAIITRCDRRPPCQK